MGCIGILSLLALLLANQTAQAIRGRFPCGYDYISKAGAWFKMHTQGAYRTEAEYTCFSEGAQLASPTSNAIKTAMMSLMVTDKSKYNETSSMLVHTVFPATEHMINNLDPRGDADISYVSIALTETGQLQIVSRYTTLPYICYKKTRQDLQLNECGTTDPEYILDRSTNHCYKFHRDKLTWISAARSCAAEGGYLAIVDTIIEISFIQSVFARYPPIFNHSDPVESYFDVRNPGSYFDFLFLGYWADDNKVWRTVQGKTLSEAGLNEWPLGPPASFFHEGYCATITFSGTIYERGCFERKPYLCEKNINGCNGFGCSKIKH